MVYEKTMIDNYIYIITALLPLAALMLVFQVNPYHALVIRAILGSVAALVYAVLGAADVALTEALVGTMLAVTLYVVAVRSSLVMRLGILEKIEIEKESYWQEIISNLRKVANKHYLRLELVKYPDRQTLEQALQAKDVHATCIQDSELDTDREQKYQTNIRVRHLFEILKAELALPELTLNYVTVSNAEKQH